MDLDETIYLDVVCDDVDTLMPLVSEIERIYSIHIDVAADEVRGGVNFITIKSTGFTPDIIFDMGCRYWEMPGN